MNPLPLSATALTPVRAEPRDDAEQVTQALAGEPLWVEEERDGWLRVRTAYGYPGWVQAAVGADVVAAARSYLGTRYEWGGMSERGIDCSGLVHMAYRQGGRFVPRDAHEQEEAGAEVVEAELRPGDLVTYGGAGGADHIAFWLGGGRILHATDREGVHRVLEEPEPDFLRARRRRLVRLAV
jgi:cell wall-associated NlpC family hydrolase